MGCSSLWELGLVSWFTEKPSTRDEVVVMEESRVPNQKTRSLQTLLIGSFDLWEASGVQRFDAFISRAEKQADGPGCRGCTTQKPPIDKRKSTVFSFCSALFTVTFVLFNGRSVEIRTPFKKGPVSKPSLWVDHGGKTEGSERGCMRTHRRFVESIPRNSCLL